jgi:methyl-accepting chemotaxis protein
MLNKIKEASKVALLIVLIVTVGNLGWNLRLFLQRTTATAENVREVSASGREYLDEQLALFRSPKYQKSIEATIQTGAYANSVLRSVNTQVLPEAKSLLVGLQGSANALTAELTAVRSLTEGLDRSLNVDILPSLQKVLSTLNLTAEDVRAAIQVASEESLLTLKRIRTLVSDPSWQRTLAEIANGTANLAATTQNVADASKRLPEIAESLSKIAKTSSKFSKVYWLSRIISILVPLIP